MKNKTVIVHSPEYASWKFSEDHPTQGRRFVNGFDEIKKRFSDSGVELDELWPRVATKAELLRVHSESYFDELVKDYRCGEWSGPRKDLAYYAQLFAGGTLVALDALINQGYKTAIHLAGAKHHAQRDHSSGFCVLADFALAADVASKDFGKRVAILDFDAHHGDGTENLTAENPDVLTFSIHEWGIFPGTGLVDLPELSVYNSPLDSATGKDDNALLREVERFVRLAEEFKPDLIFITAGADGHIEDPLSGLEYTLAGYVAVGKLVRMSFPDMPILMGGAGGYLPDTRTPEVWSYVAFEISRN
jgi:acetoin utilization protein AcuC